MTNRLTVALCAALALVGPAFAQTPAAPPPAPPAAPPPPPGPLAEGPVVPIAGCCEEPVARPRFWASADYVIAWMRGDNVPALVTGSTPGTPQSLAGILGQSTTQVLFGGTQNNEARSGFRLGAGLWFDPQQTLGVEVGFLMLESQSTLFNAASDGSVILARPFTDANTSTPQAQLIAFPGVSSGAVAVRSTSGNFTTFNVDLAEKVVDTGAFRLESLLGYRFFRYDEGLRIRQTINPTGANFVPGTQIVSGDDFATQNVFNGIDLGLRARFNWEQLSLTALFKVAVGRVQRFENISGGTTTTVPGFAPVPNNGGLLALSSNVGNHANGDWAAMPELGLNLAYRVTPNLNLRVGYSVIFLDRVGRASDQIDGTVNPNLLPPVGANPTGPSRPAFNFIRSDVWIQSVNFGLEFTF